MWIFIHLTKMYLLLKLFIKTSSEILISFIMKNFRKLNEINYKNSSLRNFIFDRLKLEIYAYKFVF